jgi:adenylate cyclase class IV
MLKRLEIEFKYKAIVGLEEFNKFSSIIYGEGKNYSVYGEDTFFNNIDKPGTFYRYRTDSSRNAQLTFKRKTVEHNNYIREEHNIDLASNCSYDQIKDFLESQGYIYNTAIHKVSHIRIYDNFVLSYYTVMDKNMNFLDKFIEIEVREDVKWKDDKEAWHTLVTLEKLCKNLGISEGARQNRSLFEMYKE